MSGDILLGYIVSGFFIVVVLELLSLIFLGFKKNYSILLIFVRFLIIFLFIIFIFFEHNIISNGIYSITTMWQESFWFYIYNPVIPFLNISLIQIFLILIIIYSFKYFKNTFKKLDNNYKYLLIFIIIIGFLYRLYIPDNIWGTGYRQMEYNSMLLDKKYTIDYVLNRFGNEYGIGFYEFLDLFKIFIKNWSLKIVFFVNTILDTINIFLVFVLSNLLWKNTRFSLWNALFYATSIPVLRLLSGEHVFIFSTTLLLISIIFLFSFNKTKHKKDIAISVIASSILMHTHNIFIMLPLIYFFYLIIYFDKKKLKKFFDKKLILLYVLLILFVIPVICIKTLGGFYLSNTGFEGNIIEGFKIFINYFDYFIINYLISPINPFFSVQINSLFIIILFIVSLLFVGDNKNGIKNLLFFILLYFILILPFNIATIKEDIIKYNFIELFNNLTYDNYKFFNAFILLTDIFIKGSVTFFIWILFLGSSIEALYLYIKNKLFKKIYLIFFGIILLLLPIFNYDKITYYFNEQKVFSFFYNEDFLNKFVKENQSKIYYDTLWENDEFYRPLGSFLKEKGIGELNLISYKNKLTYLKTINNDSLYIVSEKCYTRHNNSSSDDNECLIHDERIKNIEFIPLIEKEIICDTYDPESYCLKEKIKIGLYKIKKL